MIKKDYNSLEFLVKNYSIKDLLSQLAKISSNHAHELSDMKLKDQAHEYAEWADILRGMVYSFE